MSKNKNLKKVIKGNKVAQIISIVLVGCLLLSFVLPLVGIFMS